MCRAVQKKYCENNGFYFCSWNCFFFNQQCGLLVTTDTLALFYRPAYKHYIQQFQLNKVVYFLSNIFHSFSIGPDQYHKIFTTSERITHYFGTKLIIIKLIFYEIICNNINLFKTHIKLMERFYGIIVCINLDLMSYNMRWEEAKMNIILGI